MTEKALHDVLRKIKGKSVVVLGDCMLDEYIFGEVERISPEAPVPVVRVLQRETRAGGAANVACNIKALGGQPHLFGIVGKDTAARQLKQILRRHKISFHFLELPLFPTISKTRIIAHQQQIVRIDHEKNHRLLPRTGYERLSPRMAPGTFDACCLSDYDKGFFSKMRAQKWIAFARKKKKPICVDPKPKNMALFRGATVIAPNAYEAEAMIRFPLTTASAQRKAAAFLCQHYGVGKIVITMGAQGMFAYDGEKSKKVPALSREVYDVTGAGDTVLAALTLALAAEIPFFTACDLANCAAAVVVQKLGTSFPTQAELLAQSERC